MFVNFGSSQSLPNSGQFYLYRFLSRHHDEILLVFRLTCTGRVGSLTLTGQFVVHGVQGEHITVALFDVADKRVVDVQCVFTSSTQTIAYNVGTKQATCA